MSSAAWSRPGTPTPSPGTTGRPHRHGGEFVFGDPNTHRIAWAGHDGALPIIESTVVRLRVERLPSGAIPKPVWLWHSRTGLDHAEVDLTWQAFLRRFDIEHLPHAQANPRLDHPET